MYLIHSCEPFIGSLPRVPPYVCLISFFLISDHSPPLWVSKMLHIQSIIDYAYMHNYFKGQIQAYKHQNKWVTQQWQKQKHKQTIYSSPKRWATTQEKKKSTTKKMAQVAHGEEGGLWYTMFLFTLFFTLQQRRLCVAWTPLSFQKDKYDFGPSHWF